MKNYSKGMLKTAFLCSLCILGVSLPYAQAQDIPQGNSDMYYHQQYNSGIYTNVQYDNYYISYNDFYENLAPYGQWIDDPQYGYIWSPNVDMSFRPYYTNGHWAMTEYGNTWISDYQWGWACFHYGRWTFDAYYGWLWIPGTNWGPAWVSWRYGNGSYGWAPLAPDYQFSASPYDHYTCPRDWWIFIPCQYLYSGNYYSYYNGPQGNSTFLKGTDYIDNTYVSNNVTYVSGPRVKDYETTTKLPVRIYTINNSGSPRASSVHNNTIKMFRPAEVKPLPPTGERVAPPNAVSAPRAITTKPHGVNSTGGAVPAFRNDVPVTTTPIMIQPVAPRQNNVPKPAERADNYQYQSEVHGQQDPQARPGTHVPQRAGTLPQQKPQDRDPVNVRPSRTPPLPAPAQHPDPIPTAPAPSRPAPRPMPVQHPDPVEPSKR